MNDKHTNITNMLEQSSPKLPSQTKEVLWSKIESNLSTPVAVPSPYQFNFIPTRFLAPVALSLILVLGVGGMGTVAAAQQSKPGDLLYPLERAVEDLQLLLASDERSAELQAEFARKRLLELRAIIDEELAALGGAQATSSAPAASSTTALDISASDNTRINFAVSEFIRQLDDIEDKDVRQSVLSLIAETDGIDVGEDDDVRVRIEDDRVEFRYEDDETGERIRIREKDGEVRVEVKSDDDDDDDDDDNRDDDSGDDDNRSTSTRIIDEAEADVFAGTTTVKVALRNGSDINFTTSATTRAGVVAEIVARTGAPTAEVDAVLDFEIKDRNSRVDDRDDNNGDDSEDDDSRDDDSRDGDQSSDDEDDNSRDSNDDEDNRSDDSNDDSESEPSSTDDSEERVQIEVRVKDNRAEVQVEQGSEQDEFTLNYSDRATLIADIATQTGIPVATVSSALDLEIDD